MRISLYNGSTLYPLAGADGVSERTHSSAGDVVIAPQAALQVVGKVRAAYAQHIDRANLAHVISFTTSRQFASVEAAELWALDYDADIPRDGKLVLETVLPDTTTRVRVMTDAVVSPPQRRLLGASISLAYTVQGGVIGDGAAASVTINPAGDDNSVLYTAKTAGPTGNAITITYATPATAAATAVAVVGDAITVTPGTQARMTVAGITPTISSTLYYGGIQNGKPWWGKLNLSGIPDVVQRVYWTGSNWYVENNSGGGLWNSVSDVATPDLAAGWGASGGGSGTPVFTFLTSDASQVIDAVNADVSAVALVTAAASGTVTGAVAAVAATNLTGGAY